MMASVKPALRRQRSKLFVSCAMVAVATALALPQKAQAQSAPGAFQGNPTTTLGTVTYDRGSIGSETITVGSPNATINWSPYDANGTGPIDFLPNGYVATFVNDPNLTADYTVLNRIVPADPSRSIMLNGQIVSQITDGINASTGGHVWFYSPGGILIGSSAVIDVGGLLLSTADLPNGFTANSSGFSAYFSAPSGSTSAIQILDGAQVNALQPGSYVALVAPRIEQGGNVQVNGAAAYVAGEQLSMTMNQGLFDISVDVGTEDPNGIVHSGTTGGPASTDSVTDPHRIYMVAVPKNQALTMLLGGNVGFDNATVAGVENGQIVLSAGWTVSDSGDPCCSFSQVTTTPASIQIGPGVFNSDVTAIASTDIIGIADTGDLTFAGDVFFESPNIVMLGAESGNHLLVGGQVSLLANGGFDGTGDLALLYANSGGSVEVGGDATLIANGFVGIAGPDGTAGSAMISADAGNISIAGTTGLYASVPVASTVPNDGGGSAYGGNASISSINGGNIALQDVQMFADANGQGNGGGSTFTAGSGYGGSVSLVGSGGSISLGNLTASAIGVGGTAMYQNYAGGEGRGGNIFVNADGGSVTISGDVAAVASGFGGDMLGSASYGGVGSGGWAGLSAEDGTIDVAGSVTINAEGFGGTTAEGATGGTGGDAYGGYSIINTYGPGSITVGGATSLVSNATGGDGQTGGYARGGNAGAYGTDGTIALADIYAAAIAYGGSASYGFGGLGGTAQGGAAYVEADSNVGNVESLPTVSTITGGNAVIDTSAYGGIGGAGDGASISAGAGGYAIGGFFNGEIGSGGSFALADADGSTLQLGNVSLISEGVGGAGGIGGADQAGGIGGEGDGGLAQGGLYDLTTGGTPLGSVVFANFTADSTGIGGNGGAGPAGQGDGGAAWAGGSFLISSGTTTVGNVDLGSDAIGGSGSNGGDATGGIALLESTADSQLTVNGSLEVTAAAAGGAGLIDGGDAYGGDAEAGATDANSQLNVIGAAIVTANANGGIAGAEGVGGSGQGGTAGIHAGIEDAELSGTATFSDATVQAVGSGGFGGTGGYGYGGDAHAGTRDGTFILTGTLNGSVNGFGGGGTTVSREGYGGTFLLGANYEGDSNAASTTINSADITAIGWGATGSGGIAGGDGYGGSITIQAATENSSLAVGTLTANAKGQGGNGGDGASGGAGGYGYGGSITTSILGTATGGEWDILVRGVGGDGGAGSEGLGGNGGYGEGGSTSFYTGAGSSIDAGTYATNANGVGGTGGSGTAGSGDGGEAAGGYNEAFLDGSDANYSGTFLVTAFALGGNGANGGAASGGTSLITVNGALSANYVQSTGQAQGGDGTVAGSEAIGGNATILVNGSLSSVDGFVGSNALGGHGGATGSGGTAYAGYSGFIAETGSPQFSGQLLVQASGTGGNGTSAGDALGGTAEIYSGGSFDAATVDLNADAIGGSSSADLGGDAFAGEAVFESHGATTIGTVTVTSNGTGGDGTTGGGSGSGYSAAFRAGGGTSQVTGSATIASLGTGGNATNGTGGSGQGGYARTSAYGGGVENLHNLVVNSSGIGGKGQSGGTGSGGQSFQGWGGSVAQALDPGSQLNLTGETTLVSNGTGGAGSSGSGGGGYGGTTHLTAAGQPVTTQSLDMLANGLGGAGTTMGGDAYGGSSIIRADNADVTISGTANVEANATGGASDSGSGGNGTGGYVAATASGDLSAPTLWLEASGHGGESGTGNGGSGIGGTGLVSVGSGGSVSAGRLILFADAYGGASSGGEGGSAEAGGATLLVDGGMLSGPSPGGVYVTADAFGGTGVTGGAAQGGSSFVQLTSNGGAVDLNDLEIHSFGFGGEGVSAGGDGAAGSAMFQVANALNSGASASVQLGSGYFGNTALGGDATGASGTGGFAQGGSVAFDVGSAAVVISGDAYFGADATGGTGAGGDGGTLGGTISVAADTASFANTVFSALGSGGAISVGDLQSNDEIEFDSGGSISFGNVSAASLQFDAEGAVAGGNVEVADRLDGQAQGAIALGNIVAGPDLPALDDDFSVGLVSATSISVGNVTAPGNVGFATLGDLHTGNISSGDAVMALVGGNTVLGSLTTVSSGQVYLGDATMFLDAGGPDEFDPSLVLAVSPVPTGGSITIGGPVTTGMFRAASVGDFTAGSMNAGSSVSIITGGNFTASSIAGGTDVLLFASNGLDAGSISGGASIIAGAGESLSVGDASSNGTASFVTPGLASFTGTISAPTIGVTSGDIMIADGASLGVFGVTDVVLLSAMSDQPVIIGDRGITTESAGQYVLDEDGDVRASNVVINAVGGEGATDINIYDLNFDGSATAGGGISSVIVNTAGSVLVEGEVNYVNAGASDALSINAGDTIAVNTDNGSISMTGPGGAVAGTLGLTAHNVWVADGALLAQLEADPNFAGRDAALASNNGATNPGGYLQAGGIVATMTGSSFLVQNSGTASQPAGMTVGDGGLSIFNLGSDAASVIVSGRQVTSGGSVVDGNAFANDVEIQSTGGLSSDSSVNGCSIGGCVEPQPQPEPQPEPVPAPEVLGAESILGPVGLIASDEGSNEDKKDEDEKGDSKSSAADPAVYLINTGPMHLEQIIDEPITSGNDSPGGQN